MPLAGALDGVRVLDLTDGLAGPVAGMLLGDLGADVVRVGPSAGGPERSGRRVWDRNKRWAGFDPSRDDDAGALDRLVAGADVVLAGPAPWRGRVPGVAIWVVMPSYLLGETPWGTERESAGLVHAWLGHAWSQASAAGRAQPGHPARGRSGPRRGGAAGARRRRLLRRRPQPWLAGHGRVTRR